MIVPQRFFKEEWAQRIHQSLLESHSSLCTVSNKVMTTFLVCVSALKYCPNSC